MSALPAEGAALLPAAAPARRPLSLAQKLALAFLGLVSAVLVVNGAIDMALSWREAQATAVRVQQEKADAAAERVAQFVAEIEGQIGWTTRAEWARVSTEQRRYDFIRLLRQAPAITELIQVDGQGREQLKLSRLEPDAVGSNADLSADPRIAGALKDRAWYGPVTFRRGSEPYMAIGIGHVGRNAGATIAEVNLKLAWDVVTGIRVGETGYAFVTDRQGKLIAHPDMSLVLRDTDLRQLPQVAAAVADLSDGALEPLRVTDGRGIDGRAELSAYAAVPKLGWLVFVDLPREEAFAAVWAALWRTLALMALGVVLAGVAGMLLARRMLVPITELQAGAQKLGAGDLSLRVPVRTGDEIGALAERFNTMAGQIQAAQETLEQKVEDRTADLNEALARQTATSDILRVISRSPTDATPVFDAIVDAAVRLLQTDLAFVMLTDGTMVTPMAGATPAGRIERMVPGRPVDPDGHFPSRAIVSRSPLHLPDWSRLELPPHERGIHETFGINASLYMPLLRGDECLGVLTFASKVARAFEPKEIALAESFGDQAVIAIENTRLFNETREALERQTATADVLQVISGSMADAQPVFETILDSCERLFGKGDMGIFIADGDQLTLPAYRGGMNDRVKPMYPRPLKGTSTELVMDSGAFLHAPSVGDDPRTPAYLREMIATAGDYAVMIAPLRWDGRSIGTIDIARNPPRAFSADEQTQLQTFADQAVIAIQNARLFNEVQARTHDLEESLEQQTATAEVLKVISRSAFDLDAVFQTLVSSACSLCEADHGLIYGREGDVFPCRAVYGAPGELVTWLRQNPRRPGDGSLGGRVAASGRIEHIPDKLLDPTFRPPPQSTALSDTRTLLGVPMLRNGRVDGVFVLMRIDCKPFTPRQIALVETYADQAVIAIENARLFDEVQERTRDVEEALRYQQAIADVLGVISRSPSDVAPVLDAIAGTALDLCGALDATVLLKAGDVLRRGAYRGGLSFGRLELPLTRDYVAGRAVVDAAPVQVDDLLAAGEEYPLGLELAKQMGFRTAMAVPLMRDGAAIGCLLVRRDRIDPFSERQIELLRTFADQAVIAIGNARLFEEVQARTKDLQESLEQQTATADVLKVISRSAFNLPTVLSTLISSASKLCRAEMGLIYLLDDSGVLVPEAEYGTPPGYFDFVRANPVKIGRGSFTGRAALHGEVVNIADALEDAEFTFTEARQRADYRAILAVPLKRDGEVIGVFAMPRRTPGAYSPREIELVQSFADQAVIAIENSRLFEQVQAKTRELEASLADLTAAQTRLIQSEKLASLGQLTAGIAHEIKNPLNFVNNFADLSTELVGEIEEALAAANDRLDPKVRDEVEDISAMLKGNLAKIVQHGRRADSIVKNMLAHSRESGGERRMVDVNATAEEALSLAYHGARAEKPGFNVTLERDLDPAAGQVELYPQEFTRVLLNLIGNGFHAANKKRLEGAPDGFEPTVRLSTRAYPDRIEIRVRDNGTGIPDAVKARIFEPFFTTKPTGEGTGLGLSLSHDIVVKQHGGTLDVMTEPGHFTEFTVTLPRRTTLQEAKP